MKTTTHNNRWLSIQDFTADFGISKSTQQRLRKNHSLPYSKLGGIIRYDRLKIDAMFEQHEVA